MLKELTNGRIKQHTKSHQTPFFHLLIMGWKPFKSLVPLEQLYPFVCCSHPLLLLLLLLFKLSDIDHLIRSAAINQRLRPPHLHMSHSDWIQTGPPPVP